LARKGQSVGDIGQFTLEM